MPAADSDVGIVKARTFIGTASWTDRELAAAGTFYPEAVLTAEERLRFYARRYEMVEVDSTYYGLPSVRNSVLWSGRTPDGFRFDIKSFRLFTGHWTEPASVPGDIRLALPAKVTGKARIYYRDLQSRKQSRCRSVPVPPMVRAWQEFS